ncbi:MAG: gephyrin-like molybdotransferase Glp [Gammaproteobacteria bacterium]|nr:gephyrin-like molybdotransferase Glp [Gammaproteobacteria bacterium]
MTIAVDPSCLDDFEVGSISTAAARRRILEAAAPLAGAERVHLRAALGRVLGGDIASPLAVPGHTNSAMDGYAVAIASLPSSGTAELTVAGSSFAGHPFNGVVATGQCVRIMTGAVMPADTDTVIPQEHAETLSGARIRIDDRHREGQNVRRAGEDIRRGDIVAPRGRRLAAPDLGLLASLGVGEVTVTRRPRVAFFSTGDELRSLGDRLEPGEIYDSNRYTLYGMLIGLGADIIDMGVVADTPEATLDAFRRAAADADVVITSGGVSVGEADYIKDSVAALGSIEFSKVAMKPGRPLTFGRVGEALFFGLPGNPVSVMVTFYLFVQPALRRLAGESDVQPLILRARCQSKLRKKPGRTEYQRGILASDATGELTVERTGPQGSGILSSMAQANCFIVLPADFETAEAGDSVPVIPFGELRL